MIRPTEAPITGSVLSVMDPITLIFIGLAGFVIWRLYSVLGQRTGHEQRPPFEPTRRPDAPQNPPNNVIPMPGRPANDGMTGPAAYRWQGLAEPGSPVAQGLDAIAMADPSFDPHGFMQGARGAYEMIITAFANGDRRTLQTMLAKDVLDGFEAVIAEREAKGAKAQTTLVALDKADLVGAELKGRLAHVSISFVAQMISVVRDASGKVLEGHPDKVVEATDIWTFARDVRSRDPNWQLVETEAAS